jgi:hypothetical protein
LPTTKKSWTASAKSPFGKQLPLTNNQEALSWALLFFL